MIPLLAQGQTTTGDEAVVLVTFLFIILIVLGITLAIQIVICALLHGCFNRVPAQCRVMDGGLVWLLLIPLFNLVWNFFVYQRLSDSYQRYFAMIGRSDVGDCGKAVGLWYSICAACTLVPCVQYFAGPASLVLLIVYLVKALTLKGMIPLDGAIPPMGGAPPVAPRS